MYKQTNKLLTDKNLNTKIKNEIIEEEEGYPSVLDTDLEIEEYPSVLDTDLEEFGQDDEISIN